MKITKPVQFHKSELYRVRRENWYSYSTVTSTVVVSVFSAHPVEAHIF